MLRALLFSLASSRETSASSSRFRAVSMSARARLCTGRVPGRNCTILHWLPVFGPWLCESAPISPARINDDFPEPEGPTIARKCRAARRSKAFWSARSRPKNRCASWASKGRKPGYGPILKNSLSMVFGFGAVTTRSYHVRSVDFTLRRGGRSCSGSARSRGRRRSRDRRRERLCLDALARIDDEERTLAGGERAVDLIGEVDVAGHIHEVED